MAQPVEEKKKNLHVFCTGPLPVWSLRHHQTQQHCPISYYTSSTLHSSPKDTLVLKAWWCCNPIVPVDTSTKTQAIHYPCKAFS